MADVATVPGAAEPRRDARRLTMVISALALGGAERVLTILSEEWVQAGNSVTVINFAAPGEAAFYSLDPRVTEVRLGGRRRAPNAAAAVINNARRILRLRAAIRRSRPDVVVSFVDRTNVLSLASTLGSDIPVIVTEHTDPRDSEPSRAWFALRTLLYRRAAAVLVLTKGTLDAFDPAVRRRAVVMPNPAGRYLTDQPRAELTSPTVVAIGRLSWEKGYDRLLRAFARISPDRPSWRLVIWGEGSERATLEALRSELGLDDQVTFPGVTHAPLDELAGASILALSSVREGFPMVIVEAFACSVPVVAFDCRSGPRELIQDGFNGRLVAVNDVTGLATALAALMDDPAERRRLGANGPAVVEQFGVDRVLAAWENLFATVIRPS